MKKLKIAAIVTIKDAPKMTKPGRKKIATWLIRQSECLLNNSDELAPVFRARYLYE